LAEAAREMGEAVSAEIVFGCSAAEAALREEGFEQADTDLLQEGVSNDVRES
jgi:hypothetical protein